jgi:homocysteine S-methyltransferase
VAASVGCYGASLADGSEYRGEYGLTIEELKTWHASRFKLLAKVGHEHHAIQFRITADLLTCAFSSILQAGADLLAIETLPCEVEVRAILALLEEDAELRGVPCWVSMACRNGQELNR